MDNGNKILIFRRNCFRLFLHNFRQADDGNKRRLQLVSRDI